ncbi:lytic transglycosylase domain-containing protein [Candidatus Contubernalis alkaliaceticus]|uniref:lytic transglycosylase domain-containing protein n=1 Tax=Candidatus Contubernalis alkaliaceticus TaxID=338645 RepID=UPI001F4C3487|nr:lytic transglycosylase domain-containing protein [Candidatus Contubernalis alkalaceticus]UNC91600.1 lytic transglycosylase domain-containing protein [Candidatus Contubernalis alkalaceticus]
MAVKILKKRLVFRVLLVLVLIMVFYSNCFQRLINPIQFKETIDYYSEIHQVDPLLVSAVIRVESRFNQKAVSQKGAMGLMQIMPTTGEWAAEQIGISDFESSMLLDPQFNIRLGTWYIANLQKEFQDKNPLVIAAYNGGRGNVNKWLEQKIWDGQEETIYDIPYPETREYVKKVLFNYRKYQKIYE